MRFHWVSLAQAGFWAYDTAHFSICSSEGITAVGEPPSGVPFTLAARALISAGGGSLPIFSFPPSE